MDQQSIQEIVSLYEQQLVIPPTIPLQPFLLCPVGIVGAGKTTVLKPLAAAFSLLRISTDELRELFIEKQITNTQEDIVHAIGSLIQKYLTKGYGIAIDANCSTNQESLENLGKKLNVPLVWIHITASEVFILNKLRNYNHGKLFKDADEAIASYHDNKKNHQHLTMPFVYTFDTSRENLNNQIHEAIVIIRNLLSAFTLH